MKTKSLIYNSIPIFISGNSMASGSSGDYTYFGLLLSVPSIIVIIILYLYIIKQTNLTQNKVKKINIVGICTLISFGVCLNDNGVLIPNWVAFMSGNYIAPIIYSIALQFFFFTIYKKKWKKNNHKIESEK